MIAGINRTSGVELFASQLKTLVLLTPSCFRKCPLESLQALGVFTVPCTGPVFGCQIGKFRQLLSPPSWSPSALDGTDGDHSVQVEWQGDVSDQLLFD
jgi:hypothetical protein